MELTVQSNIIFVGTVNFISVLKKVFPVKLFFLSVEISSLKIIYFFFF